MLNQNGEAGQRIIESDQQTDTFVSTSVDGQVGVRLCSVRCQESQIDVAPNQDYARVVFSSQGPALSFCVCDGVGGSFLGNFAARYIAVRMTDFLLTLPAVPRDPRKTALTARKHLTTWAIEAQNELNLLGLPLVLPSLEREILEEQRNQHGSATVFFCGRVDYAPSVLARSAKIVPALFCWMGNVTARIFSTPGVCQQLGDQDNDRNRWSTLFGQQGILTIRVSALNRSEPLIVHTDGLDPLGHQLAQLDDQQLQNRIWQLLQMPSNDDMTMLDLRWADAGTIGRVF
jgi:hypothetical protein